MEGGKLLLLLGSSLFFARSPFSVSNVVQFTQWKVQKAKLSILKLNFKYSGDLQRGSNSILFGYYFKSEPVKSEN